MKVLNLFISLAKSSSILRVTALRAVIAVIVVTVAPIVEPVFAVHSFAQTTADSAHAHDGIRYGIVGMGVYNRHTAQFLNLPGTTSKQREDVSLVFGSQSGIGFGFGAGGFVEIPLLRWLNLDIRGSYLQHGGTMYSALDSLLLGRRDGTGAAGLIRREFQASLASVGVEALLAFNPIGSLNLYAGIRAEWAVAKTYKQVEVLIAPSDGIFETGQRTRNELSGTLPQVRNYGVANMNTELVAGVGYEFPLQPSAAWTIEPTAFYARQMNSVVQNLAADEFWRIDALRAGVALRYYPVREARFDAQAFKVQQLVTLEKQIMQERTKIQAELHELRQAGVLVKLPAPVGVMADGSVVEQPTVRVEEFRSNVFVQLLPHIFFNEQSSVLPARYQRISASDRKNYSFAKLVTLPAPDVHFHLLNIVGKRLQDKPEARVTLTGYNVGAKEEKNPRNFARQRAEAVSDYLQDVWKVAASRITVKEQTITDAAASTAETQADGRRVDIASDDVSVLQPLTLDNVYRTVTPPALRYTLDISAGAGLKQWSLEMSQLEGNEVRTLKTAEGTSSVPKEYVWRIDEQAASIPNVSGSIETRLEVTDVNNRNGDAPIQSTPVTVVLLADKIAKQAQDVRVDVVTLVAPLGKTISERYIEAVVQPLVSASSSLVAEGWAEGAGENVNTQGADARAREVIRLAQARMPNLAASVKSSVPTTPWMKPLNTDPTIPEGRLYNRAVRVEIRSSSSK
jgi:hypothetical protein